MRDSAGLLDDSNSLRARLAADGYLFLRGILDSRDVMAARAEIFQRLAEVGEIRSPAAEGIATGTSRRREIVSDLGAFWKSVSEGTALRRVTHGVRLCDAAAAALGAPARPFDFLFLRAGAVGRFTGIHCDSPFFVRTTANIVTAWVALGAVPLEEGPIFVVEGSHRFDDLNDSIRDYDYARDPGRRATLDLRPAAFAEARGCRLLTADFAPGDVLLFGMFTWHGSFDNQSAAKRVRLSCDVRFQPVADPVDERYFGPDPGGTTGTGYGELNGAKPLTDPWHVR